MGVRVYARVWKAEDTEAVAAAVALRQARGHQQVQTAGFVSARECPPMDWSRSMPHVYAAGVQEHKMTVLSRSCRFCLEL